MNSERKETPGVLVFRAIYPFFVYFFIALAVELAIILPQSIELINEWIGMGYQEVMDKLQEYIYGQAMFLTGVSSFAALPVLYYFYVRDKKYWPVKVFTEGKKQPAANYVYIIILGFIVSLAFNNLFDIIGLTNISDTYNRFASAIDNSPYFWRIVATVVAAPLVEEMVFRGLMQKRLRRCLGRWQCIVISALAFGITHGNIVQFLYAFAVGMLLAYVYEIYRNLWAPVILHAMANLTAVMLAPFINNVESGILRALIVALEISLVYGALVLMNKKTANNLISEEKL